MSSLRDQQQLIDSLQEKNRNRRQRAVEAFRRVGPMPVPVNSAMVVVGTFLNAREMAPTVFAVGKVFYQKKKGSRQITRECIRVLLNAPDFLRVVRRMIG